jgi:hypothetical protein
MTLNLIKLCVGVDEVEELVAWHRKRRNKRGNNYHRTRMMPTRAAEILEGGSLYWVVKGFIQVRQPILGLTKETGEGGRPVCVIELAPVHILVQPTAHRAFQGWRYFKSDAAPPDIKHKGKSYIDPDMPKALKLELMRLGLI